MSHDKQPPEDSSTPDEIDDGLAFAYGQDSQQRPESDPTPSVIARIGEITGSKPKVLLRDDRAGDTPKPASTSCKANSAAAASAPCTAATTKTSVATSR